MIKGFITSGSGMRLCLCRFVNSESTRLKTYVQSVVTTNCFKVLLATEEFKDSDRLFLFLRLALASNSSLHEESSYKVAM